MLFRPVTFITPGVDALTMTNGVRVEWLNSVLHILQIEVCMQQMVVLDILPDGSTTILEQKLR